MVKQLYRKGIAKPSDTQHDRLLLQLLIMEELKKQTPSKFKHYINMVHTDWSNFPLLFEEEDLHWLQGSPLLEWTQNDLANQKAQYDFFGQHIAGFKSEYSLRDFMEASKSVTSRCFEQPELGIWLTPFGDLLNHQNPPHLLWRYYENDEGRKGWIARANQDLEKGVQVYTSYGRTPSQYMFPTYGFLPVTEEEEYDVFLELKIKKDELRDLK